LVGTPIGNLEDISQRALRILREVDLIACEDTRHTARLLSHYGITTRTVSCHEHNERQRADEIVALLREGKNVALVTDAGMPLVSDPGRILVQTCREQGIAVTPIPGPSAAIAALAGAGLSADEFLFIGFLPARPTERKRKLEQLAPLPYTLILYEAPHRILRTLEDIVAVLGARPAALARELTKLHEEWLRAPVDEILQTLRRREKIQGEITLVLQRGEGAPPKQPSWPASLEEHLQQEMTREGLSHQEALKAVARQRGISRKEAYRLLLQEKKR
jgi:16S rRNA (cytidine1402-2'-O)-methyltransferase